MQKLVVSGQSVTEIHFEFFYQTDSARKARIISDLALKFESEVRQAVDDMEEVDNGKKKVEGDEIY